MVLNGPPDCPDELIESAPGDDGPTDSDADRACVTILWCGSCGHASRRDHPATYVAGRRLPPSAAGPPPPWVPLSEAQQQAEADRVDAIRAAAAPRLDRLDDFHEPFPRAGASQ